jgi:hypothetical protein
MAIITELHAQEPASLRGGKVSYITEQNIYVKFETTGRIHVGDTIFRQLEGKLVPLLVVENISSVSCVGKALDSSGLKVGDDAVARLHPEEPTAGQKEDKKQTETITELPSLPAAGDSAKKEEPVKRKQDIQGSISESSYMNLSNTSSDDSYRMRYSFSMRANNLAASRLSAESYITFTHKMNEWAEVKENIFSALKIYSLALKYDLSPKTSISAGRRVNNNLSNIGAVDGIQAETGFGQFTTGIVAGSRPSDADYSLNLKLLEYGGFIAHNAPGKNGRVQTSAAFFEQRNTGITDRRFAYFQHDNSLLKNLYLFTSCELDLYRKIEEVVSNKPSLTSLYVSLRYRPFKQLSLFGSYDARKNVIYFETYKSFADRLLEEATRQGLQLKVNWRPGNLVNMGVNAGYRFREGDRNPNENLGGYFTINNIPKLKATATLTANLLKTSYLTGGIYGIGFTKDLIPGKLYTALDYRFIDYAFLNTDTPLIQHVAQVNLSWQILKKMSLSVDYELTIEKISKYHRIYISFSRRF